LFSHGLTMLTQGRLRPPALAPVVGSCCILHFDEAIVFVAEEITDRSIPTLLGRVLFAHDRTNSIDKTQRTLSDYYSHSSSTKHHLDRPVQRNLPAHRRRHNHALSHSKYKHRPWSEGSAAHPESSHLPRPPYRRLLSALRSRLWGTPKASISSHSPSRSDGRSAKTYQTS
jgi:hypothetical protein